VDNKSDYFKAVFKTPNGKKVLQDLHDELNSDAIFVNGDSHKTSYNLGRRDAYIYINQLLRIDKDE
jgi:hypothetical protein